MIAHINSVTGERQSVRKHCEETARIAAASIGNLNLKNTATLLGWLHDMGKCTVLFQSYIEKAIQEEGRLKKGEVNHSSSGAIFVYERYYKGDDMHRLTAQLISVAIYSHHGQYDILSPEGKDIYTLKLQRKDEIGYTEAYNNYVKECLPLGELDILFEKSVSEVTIIYGKIEKLIVDYEDKQEKRTAMYFYFSCLQRMLLSILIDADRLDTAVFCGDRSEKIKRAEISNLWNELNDTLEKELKGFLKVDKISLLRRKISEDCLRFSNEDTGIYQLMVPTGGGKTLSSLRYSLAHASRYHKDRIFYVAPFMSILDQNADVIKKILHNENIILEHHSNVINETWNEAETNEWRHLTENWDNPIILTTMVQMLNTLFDGRTQCVRRMHSLANSIIIFDEIQSLPVKCIHIFNLTINFLSYVCGATVILCSATQPLLDRKVQYKILLGKPPSIMRNIEEVYQNFKRVEVKNLIKADKYDADDLTELIMKIMENSDNVLTIMNTKGAARRLYNTVKERVSRSNDNENIIMMLLTTHMCPKHRLHLINDMRDKLGKEKIICISTSLIEAGVDISFDNVIRSLTGLDSIAQAAGRCNRNGIGKTGTVYIINSKDEDLSKLPEIKTAQNATSLILENYKNDPEYFKNDLFSPFTLELFYKKYFYEIRNEMNYRIRDKNTNLLDLLSDNTSGVRAYKTNNQEYPQMLLNQAFKTAGEEFEVIVNQAQSVIVPYNEEAKQLIAILEGNSEMDAIKMALRKVQVYTVNLYQNEFIILDKLGGITALKNVNIFVLTEGFYSNETGITKDTNLDFLLI